ncbi:hypothetical protein DSECCO2_541930 [anaerobic digester metagenome]
MERMIPKGFLISWAMPATMRPMPASFSCCWSSRSSSSRSAMRWALMRPARLMITRRMKKSSSDEVRVVTMMMRWKSTTFW